MNDAYLLQGVKVGALAKNRHGLRNARSKTAARALNAPVRMLARLQAIVAQHIFSPFHGSSARCHRNCCHFYLFFTGVTKPRPIQSRGIIESVGKVNIGLLALSLSLSRSRSLPVCI